MKEQADIPFNVWERAEALAMAVRLHVKRKAPEQIENLLGTSVMKIVYMATCMMVNRDKGFAPMAKMFSRIRPRRSATSRPSPSRRPK